MIEINNISFCFLYQIQHSDLQGLTHWGRVMHICFSKLTINGSDNGLSPGQHQAIIWTNAGIFLIQTLRTNFSEILSKIHAFSFKKMHLKMSSAKCRPFCLDLNVLMGVYCVGSTVICIVRKHGHKHSYSQWDTGNSHTYRPKFLPDLLWWNKKQCNAL